MFDKNFASIMCFAVLISFARSWDSTTFPDISDKAACNGVAEDGSENYICDPDATLSESEKERFQAISESYSYKYRSCNPIVGYRVGVAVGMDITAPDGYKYDQIRNFCGGMLTRWSRRVADGCENALLVCYWAREEEVVVVGTDRVDAFADYREPDRKTVWSKSGKTTYETLGDYADQSFSSTSAGVTAGMNIEI